MYARSVADLPTTIEALEHRWMRAWVSRDRRVLKALTSGNFRLLVGSRPPVILDAASWLEAAATRYRCGGYHFGEVYVRDLGAIAVFATRVALDATMDDADWSGDVWITDIWRKAKFRQKWRMVERVISRPENDQQVPAAVRSLQLWR